VISLTVSHCLSVCLSLCLTVCLSVCLCSVIAEDDPSVTWPQMAPWLGLSSVGADQWPVVGGGRDCLVRDDNTAVVLELLQGLCQADEG